MQTELSRRLLEWYDLEQRQLPWRGHPDAYAVWVSEIMLQQTRVDTVIPYFERWMQRFPTIQSLASASEQEVLQSWEGLGYYSRARNMRKAARQVMEQFNGTLPQTRAELQQLPGIGPYTAGAISSIAFGQAEAALDGNIRRVIARFYAIREPARAPTVERRLWDLTRQNLPPDRSGDYNQALMDLGAAICTPRAPKCLLCPLSRECRARLLGIQEELPVLAKRPEIPHYLVTAAVLQRDGKVLIGRRPEKDLLGGMWEFPGGTVETGEELVDGLRREIREELGAEISIVAPFGVYRHAYTHFKVTLHAFLCQVEGLEPQALEASELRWVTRPELANYPMGKIDRLIANRLTQEQW